MTRQAAVQHLQGFLLTVCREIVDPSERDNLVVSFKFEEGVESRDVVFNVRPTVSRPRVFGRLMGKGGRNIKAIEALMKAAGSQYGLAATVILEQN